MGPQRDILVGLGCYGDIFGARHVAGDEQVSKHPIMVEVREEAGQMYDRMYVPPSLNHPEPVSTSISSNHSITFPVSGQTSYVIKCFVIHSSTQT